MPSVMNILFLSQLLPYPLDAGPKVRSYYVLRRLAAAGHEVTLLAFTRESDTDESLRHLESLCAAVHTVPMIRSRSRDIYHLGRSLLSGRPFLIARDHVPAMTDKVRQLAAGGFDAIHADQLWMAPYALAGREATPGAPPRLVLDQHNAMALIPQRLAESEGGGWRAAFWRREAGAMRRYEPGTCLQFDHVVWVTDEDRAAVGLERQPGHLGPHQHTIPICIDPGAQMPIERTDRPHRVTFLGGLHWPPNADGVRWFAREVWPLVVERMPEAVLTLIGKDPPAELRDGANWPGRTDITGYVADPTPYLRETAVFIVPLRAGGGMRVKILDAWRWGLPVVSTAIGAEGIDYRDGQDLIIADDAPAFAAAVVKVCGDPALAGRLAAGGRATITRAYDWRSVYRQWDDIYS